jgi:multiple sugar transport system ATP-binding protein
VRAGGDVNAGHGDTIHLTPQAGRIHRFGDDGKAMA